MEVGGIGKALERNTVCCRLEPQANTVFVVNSQHGSGFEAELLYTCEAVKNKTTDSHVVSSWCNLATCKRHVNPQSILCMSFRADEGLLLLTQEKGQHPAS